jgi:hypothetical protein
MGEPIIIWPPGCGNFMPYDGSACWVYGLSDCDMQYYGQDYIYESYGYVVCC